MRIAIVRARYSSFGGAERIVARAMSTFKSSGLDVTVIARHWAGSDEDVKAGSWLPCDPFYLGSTWRDAGFARAVRRLVRREKFDLVQTHERISGLDIYRAGDGVHAVWLERRARQTGGLKRLGMALNIHHHYLRAVERRLFEHPDLRCVICNSTMVRDEILSRFSIPRDRLEVIHNGVDLNRFTVAPDDIHRQRQRAALGIAGNAPVLLLVGSGFERKGVAQSISAIRAFPDVHLIVVGHDKHLPRYKDHAHRAAAGSRVHFVGPTRDPLPFYHAADGFILPSLYDPFPNSVLEAMACGLPAIVSEGCGAKELIRENETGWVVSLGHPESIEQAVGKWRGRLGGADATLWKKAVRQDVMGFDIRTMTDRLQQLYQRLLRAG